MTASLIYYVPSRNLVLQFPGVSLSLEAVYLPCRGGQRHGQGTSRTAWEQARTGSKQVWDSVGRSHNEWVKSKDRRIVFMCLSVKTY